MLLAPCLHLLLPGDTGGTAAPSGKTQPSVAVRQLSGEVCATVTHRYVNVATTHQLFICRLFFGVYFGCHLLIGKTFLWAKDSEDDSVGGSTSLGFVSLSVGVLHIGTTKKT